MHRVQLRRGLLGERRNIVWLCTLMIVLALVVSACGNGGDEPEVTEPEPAVEEPAEEPAEEEAEEEAEPAEEPAEEEAEATEEPAEEEAEPAEEAAEEEAEATEEPAEGEEEAEEPAEEEAEATPEPEEAPADVSGDVDSGEYIATLTGGCGCHFNQELGGLAGGNDFDGSFGVTYAPNITPHEETGIGSMSEDEVVTMIRTGAHPDGYQLVPVMPYPAFSALSDQEALDLVAYLFAQEPIGNEVPEREVTEEPEPFTPDSEPPAEKPTDPVARGEQLTTIARCGGCHTPYNEDGTQNMDMMFAGGPISEDEIAANITPHEETGIGAWSEEEIATYMTTGERPDGTQAEGSMAQQIDRRFHLLTEEDAMAIAAYLKSVPAVENDPFAE